MENKLREITAPEPEAIQEKEPLKATVKEHTPKPAQKAVRGFGSAVGSVLKGEILNNEKVIKRLPFILFLAGLSLLYIANAYSVERKMNKIQKLNKQVKDLHSKYVSVKAELMYNRQQSEIAAILAEEGIKESVTPPKVIKINDPNAVNLY